ncbi:MAG TPA: hypothetical protein V6D50_03620 [Chroococcales cyanobacterium]
MLEWVNAVYGATPPLLTLAIALMHELHETIAIENKSDAIAWIGADAKFL